MNWGSGLMKCLRECLRLVSGEWNMRQRGWRGSRKSGSPAGKSEQVGSRAGHQREGLLQ